ncbi:MAG: radical SAM protein [bacterium]
MLKINEIFKSIQGESSYAGLPCVFIRLSGCNLNCTYCDTQYARKEEYQLPLKQVLTKVKGYNCKLIEVTGGEPLLQDSIYDLCEGLLNEEYKVLLETNGSLSVSKLDPRIIKIMDVKCPGSGEAGKNQYENISFLRPDDEIKFVLTSFSDYEWAYKVIGDYDLTKKCKIILSPSHQQMEIKDLAERVLKDNLNVRCQIQLHKYIWGADKRGI